MGFFNVRRRFALFFLLYYGSVGIFLPYLGLYLERNGITGGRLGLILGGMPLIGVVGQPLWSMLADVYGMRKDLLSLTCLGTAVCSLLMGLVSDYGWLLVTVLALAFMRAPTVPLGNALTLDYLEKRGDEDGYGPLRSWGSLGFAVTSLLAGTFFVNRAIHYLPFVYAASLVILVLLTRALPDAPVEEETPSWTEGLRLLPERPSLALFFLGAMLIFATIGTAIQYISIFMEGLGAPGWLIGLSVSSLAIFEVPLMSYTPRLMDRYPLSSLLLAGVVLQPLRWLIYALLREPLLILPTQVLHSIAITAIMVVAVSFVDRQLPPRWRATGQGLHSAAVLGMGPALGQFIAGFVYGGYGIRALWWLFAALSVVGIGVMGGALRRMKGEGEDNAAKTS
jgi:PPP family 3-phenylpropionic acid transporter